MKKALLTFSIFLLEIQLSEQNKCMHAIKGQQCHRIYSLFSPHSKSSTCRWHRIRFINRCSNLIVQEDSEPQCTQECRHMLIKMNKKLNNFLFCECNDDMECLWFQQRTFRCLNETLKYKKNCDIERQKCENNTVCYDLYANWFKQCQDMFTGYRCTRECLLAEEDLYSNAIGQSLKTCECAGNKARDKLCRSERMNREKICSKKHVNSVDTEYFEDKRMTRDAGQSSSNGGATLFQSNTFMLMITFFSFVFLLV